MGISSISWPTLIIGLLTLIISIVALVLSFRNRRNAMRENVFNRQLNAYVELLELLYCYQDLLDDFATDIEFYEDEDKDEIDVVISGITKIEHELRLLFHKNSIFLPPRILSTSMNWVQSCVNVRKELKVKLSTKVLDVKQEEAKLFELFTELLNIQNELRTEIGIDELINENRRLIQVKKDNKM